MCAICLGGTRNTLVKFFCEATIPVRELSYVCFDIKYSSTCFALSSAFSNEKALVYLHLFIYECNSE